MTDHDELEAYLNRNRQSRTPLHEKLLGSTAEEADTEAQRFRRDARVADYRRLGFALGAEYCRVYHADSIGELREDLRAVVIGYLDIADAYYRAEK